MAIGVVVAAFAAVTALRWFVDGSGQAVALLYVVPIALGALWFGRRGGIAAAASGASLFVVLAIVHGRGDLDATGWIDPVVVMALVGGIVGVLAERAAHERAAAARQAESTRRLEDRCERQYDALEASDALVQKVAAARWLLEAGAPDRAVDLLTSGVADGIEHLRTTRAEH